MNLNLENPFNEPISFEAMKIAFSLFENASNSDSIPDDIQVLLEKNIIFTESESLAIATEMRLLALIGILNEPACDKFIDKFTNESGEEFMEVNDALIYAAAKSPLNDDGDYMLSDIIEISQEYFDLNTKKF